MRFLIGLKRVVFFERPQAVKHTTAEVLHAKRWDRWTAMASVHYDQGLKRQIAKVLWPELCLVMGVILFHVTSAFGAAWSLKLLLKSLLTPSPSLWLLSGLAAAVIALTFFAWLSLNHVFFIAELIGVGARSYVERRLLLARGVSAGEQEGWLPAFDREGARIESAWRGGVILVLATATVLFTAAFFFLALGWSAIAALSLIVLSSLAITHLAKIIHGIYQQISLLSTNRIALATFVLNNRLSVVIHRWGDSLLASYAKKRDQEAQELRAEARLIAVVNLVSAITPIAALLLSALLQVWWLGQVNVSGLLAAIALIGGLRSVANNIPYAIQSLTQGSVAHARVAKLLAVNKPVDSTALPLMSGRHIAITGKSGSGRSTVLSQAAHHCDASCVVYIGSEPWLFTGSLQENITVYRPNATQAELLAAMAEARLESTLLKDSAGYDKMVKGSQWGISRGQAKRVELARALLANAEAIYIDQPTMGLDLPLASGLLKTLLEGPWRNTSVVYVTDKLDEIACADQLWRVENGVVIASIAQVKCLDGHIAPVAHVDDSPQDNVSPIELEDAMAIETVHSRDSIVRKISRFGILPLCLWVVAVFVLREAFAIAGDYLLAHGAWGQQAASTAYRVMLVVMLAAVFTWVGSWLMVRGVIRRASFICVHYLTHMLNPAAWSTTHRMTGPLGKISWDQRRIDEILPTSLLEGVGALTLLTATIGFVLLNNVLLLILFVPMIYVLVRLNQCALPFLASASVKESHETAALLQNVGELVGSTAQWTVGKDKTRVVQWLGAAQRRKAYASIDNAATQRWFSYSIDLVGVLAFALVAVASVVSKGLGVFSVSAGLALSLSYSLIAIFGRASRTGVELRQLLDSTDRLCVTPTGSALALDEAKTEEGINFDHVSYHHSTNHSLLMHDFSLHMRSGDVIVVTGSSGVGKSTFASLILGESLPTRGCVRVLGGASPFAQRDIRPFTVQWLTSMPVFKPGTLRDHIAPVSSDQLAIGLQLLALDSIVDLLPQGLNHEISVSGEVPLSQSQLQRLALCRVLMHPPKILILDEATSELPGAEELTVMQTLVASLPQTVIIIITHNSLLNALASQQLCFTGKNGRVEIKERLE